MQLCAVSNLLKGPGLRVHRRCQAISRPPVRAAPLQSVSQQQEPTAVVAANPAQKAARPICVAVDDTLDSWYAVRWTLEHLYREGDVLHLVHTVPRTSTRMPLPAAFLASANESMDYEDMLDAHASEFISQTMVELASQVKRAQCQVDVLHVANESSDAVADAVCRRIEELDAAVVVLSGTERSFLEELFAGPCIARRVLEKCRRPVCIV